MQIPKEVKNILGKLNNASYEAYIVGGCVRDLLLGKTPKDWDITTSANPEEIQKIFPESFYENKFGTVTVKTESKDPTLREIQITPYRTEAKYTDKRHPDEIKFTNKLENDLARRDFTINALAMKFENKEQENYKVTDLFNGQKDIENKTVKAVGEPNDRFNEDALRLLRAVRFAVELGITNGWKIEDKTFSAIKANSGLLKKISAERIRDEFIKIINSKNAREGVELLKDSDLLEQFIPELLEGVGVGQNLHHIYNVWEHNLNALKYAADQNYSTEIRIASLFHDIGKPRVKRGEGKYSTFYGHEVVGAKMTHKIMERLKFSKKTAEKITTLVRWHLFYYNVDEVTESAVRRLLANVGKENSDDLIKLREADRIGSGVPKAKPYKLRHLEYIIDKVSSDPISVKMLKVNGNDLMKELKLEPGPKLGLLLNSLLAKVLNDPSSNKKEILLETAKELNKKNEKELRSNLKRIEEEIKTEEIKRKRKYHV